MARGFGTGVLWGVVVSALGLATLSQLVPLPQVAGGAGQGAEVAPEGDAAAETAAAAEKEAAERAAAERAAAEKAEAEKVAAEKAAAEKAAAEKVAAEKAAAEKAAAETEAAEKAAAEKAAAKAPEVALAEGPVAPAPGEALPGPGAPATEAEPSLTDLDQALTVPPAEIDPAPAEPAPARPEAAGDALLLPGQPAGQAEPERLPQIAPEAETSPAPEVPAAQVEPAPDAAPEPSPAATLKDDAPTLPTVEPLEDKLPTSVKDKEVPGVKTGALPQVGVEPEAAPEVQADLPPLVRFARTFAPEGKPLFAILLRDVGEAGMKREDLASLLFPVSVVIDPLAPDATEAEAAWRAAGQEVVMLANGIPEGATAGDIETTFATLARMLPQAVAVIDQDLGGFQDQRALATLVLPVIEGQGRGLITYDRGLNAADQIARREGVAAATIFRRLDAEGESRQTIRRYLDRAAFKAAQEGAVVVIGDTRPETVAAILEWTVEGKAGTVSLAPITAVMGR